MEHGGALHLLSPGPQGGRGWSGQGQALGRSPWCTGSGGAPASLSPPAVPGTGRGIGSRHMGSCASCPRAPGSIRQGGSSIRHPSAPFLKFLAGHPSHAGMSFCSLLFRWLLSSCFPRSPGQSMGSSRAGAAAVPWLTGLGGHSSSRRCFSPWEVPWPGLSWTPLLHLVFSSCVGKSAPQAPFVKENRNLFPVPFTFISQQKRLCDSRCTASQGHSLAPRGCSQISAVSHWLLCRIN